MPRRPGGKYKGLVVRAKGEDTLALEAEEKEHRKRARAVQRAQELRKRNAVAGHSLKKSKEEEAEERLEKIMNLLMGGKKSITKYFMFWQVGVRNLKKDRAMRNREWAWRQCCVHPDQVRDGHCHAPSLLDSITFEMPFEGLQRERKRQEQRKSTSFLPPTLQELEQGIGKDPRIASLNRRFSTMNASDDNFRRAEPSPKAKGKAKAKALSLPPPPQLSATQPGRPKWISADIPEHAYHHSTGRLCRIDPFTMRMEFVPVANEEAWRQGVLPNASKRGLL
eukprot:TRINITY_DN84795_c0_g1_i1.p1 TRINITY_DN84795_c0_g1~~TRINITY_DN84795_c0_g1_i1.p1  ORF type:complete len:280 (+),score=52.37 TRINITY_DN84795_c0_g1_i1:142-981(+)